MFLEYFGLREQPFGMTPDPAYLYASRTHGDALASLSIGVAENRGFFALIAEPGMGKTTLMYQLLEDLRESTRTVLVFQTQCTSREFIEYILQELGVDVKGMALVAMHGKLNEILFEELLAGKRFVLVVDEAQNLDDSVLETVRMLSNFETHNAKLLQIILAGQPGLASKLAQPRLAQLRQRVAVLSRLEPFSLEETGLYIGHRLKVAGYCGEPIFDEASLALIARESKGIPRSINNICYNSLFLSYTRGHRTVTAGIVKEVVARLEMEPPAAEPPSVADPAATPDVPDMVIPDVPTTVTPVATAAAAGMVIPAATTATAAKAAAASTSAKSSSSYSAPVIAPSIAPNTAPSIVPSIVKDRRTKTFLTYNAGKKISLPKWPARSAILAVILLSGTLVLAILGRSASRQGLTPAIFDQSSASNTFGALIPADRSEGATANYDAAPQDTGNGQVLTVMASPQQTLKEITLKYVGHFDDELSKKIRDLNPDLKDPDHLEAGQLIRIPLPPGAMKKVNDTAEVDAASEPETPPSLYSKFTALLRARK